MFWAVLRLNRRYTRDENHRIVSLLIIIVNKYPILSIVILFMYFLVEGSKKNDQNSEGSRSQGAPIHIKPRGKGGRPSKQSTLAGSTEVKTHFLHNPINRTD